MLPAHTHVLAGPLKAHINRDVDSNSSKTVNSRNFYVVEPKDLSEYAKVVERGDVQVVLKFCATPIFTSGRLKGEETIYLIAESIDVSGLGWSVIGFKENKHDCELELRYNSFMEEGKVWVRPRLV